MCREFLLHKNVQLVGNFTFSDTKAALEITHPVEAPSCFKALCSAYQVLLSLKVDISEVMRTKRTSYAKRYISMHTPQSQLNMDKLLVGEFVLDDCLHAEFRTFSGPKKSRDSTAVPYRPTVSPLPRKVGTYFFAFLFEQILFLGKPILAGEELQHPSSSPDHSLRDYYPDNGWNFGSAIHTGTPFDVICAISLAEIIHVERVEDGKFRFSYSASHLISGYNEIFLTCSVGLLHNLQI